MLSGARGPRHTWSLLALVSLTAALSARAASAAGANKLRLNEGEYFSSGGVDVMAFQDVYPEGHQGGVGIIQHGVRVATNGDLRLEPAPGQWAPVPVQKSRVVDRAHGTITTTLAYPDPDKDRRGFNPIDYPDLRFTYQVRVRAEGAGVRITVDLDQPLPAAWADKVGFNLELYPAALFGKTFYAGDRAGAFPRQPNGPVRTDAAGAVQPIALGSGRRVVVAPESPAQRLTIESRGAPLELLDGRINHPNGWFIARALVTPGATAGAIDWLVTPNALAGWRSPAVVHVSQVGYHPAQRKLAVIEVDAADTSARRATLVRVGDDGRRETVRAETARPWGKFLRYRYLQLDFTNVTREGVYQVQYGDSGGRGGEAAARSEPFRIARDVYQRDVWQPTLEVFLPVQMCHMRVVEKYRVWHGLCHQDDALMAPVAYNHFDGYNQGPDTLTRWKPLEPVPGLDAGGWHDAGDDDLRIESQAGEVYVLTLAHEAFDVRDDSTTIDQRRRTVEIRQPDGKPDILQQIQHGLLHVVGAWKALGRFPRGMIVPTLAQYTMLGDIANQTDNLVYDPRLKDGERNATRAGRRDDRMVFTEHNPARALAAAAFVAAGARAMRGFDDALAADALRAAEGTWRAEAGAVTSTGTGAGAGAGPGDDVAVARVHAAVELFLSTRKDEYRAVLVDSAPLISARIDKLGWIVARALEAAGDRRLTDQVRGAVRAYAEQWAREAKETPFGIPYRPVIWGAGWGIQELGVRQYFLHAAFPDLVGPEAALAALDFVLGVHPGANTASFASGVGARSMTTAYGWNRADWSYIPGGVVSGTNLIRPDFPEMKDFPFLWQQGEYVLGGGASNFMFLVLAADHMLNDAGAPR